MSVLSYVKALNRALDEELTRDGDVFLIGEDVGAFGGCFGVTSGLVDKYGESRLIDTPISEAAICSTAFGAAAYGLRPVAELMFADFVSLGYDTIMNMAPQQRYLACGELTVPLVIRGPQGVGVGAAAHHSQDVSSWVLNAPGITIVCPSTPDEAYGLLKSSIRSDNFVLFLEHKGLYSSKGEVHDEEHLAELGKAKIVREGTDVTIIANQLMRVRTQEAIAILEKDGISVELIDPLTIKPYDKETLAASVSKTGRVLIVTEARHTGSYAAEFGIELQKMCFGKLKKPVERLCALDLPIPKGFEEGFILPGTDDIIDAVRALMQ
jgi:pyruvate dehydrogenase E1 component beta subunit